MMDYQLIQNNKTNAEPDDQLEIENIMATRIQRSVRLFLWKKCIRQKSFERRYW